ncbi:MAG: phytanoyl-CoA dioxygenase family protein [Bryobacteraceae bacterium]|nr:phytanoyl-CoA dioxygenase family protein [Bryobacteraceae bacterium]
MNANQRDFLFEHGYLVLERWMPDQLLAELTALTEQLFEAEGENAGSEFRQEPNARRLANMVAKGEVFGRIMSNPEILGYVGSVLGPRFKLSSLNARSANPHSHSRQPLHVDMGLLPDDDGFSVCNTVWMLDEFTSENGALRVVPRSHRWGSRPQEGLPDPEGVHPDEILVTAPRGTVVIMNAHLWHGGTENRTDAPRRALHGFYCRWDIPQQQYQKRLIPPEVQAGFSPKLREVLALDDPHNDEISSPMTKASGFLK